MHTYVSLTLAKTPHLPIKRRKVIHIGQPSNRDARDRGGSRSTCRNLERDERLVITWPGLRSRETSLASRHHRARMFSSSLLGEMWTPFGNCFSWHPEVYPGWNRLSRKSVVEPWRNLQHIVHETSFEHTLIKPIPVRVSQASQIQTSQLKLTMLNLYFPKIENYKEICIFFINDNILC